MARKRRSVAGIMIWPVIASLSWSSLMAEILPVSGTAEGIYHQDCWGVGHLDYFIVHPNLHAKLHPYEGQRIRFKITKAEQPINPGPGILLGLDEIEKLPSPPFDILIKTRPAKVRIGQPFQVVVETINRSKDSNLYLISQPSVSIHQPGDQPKTGKPWDFLKDYTDDQLAIQNESITSSEPSTVNFSSSRLDSRSNLLPPGSSLVSAYFSHGISHKEGEVALDLSYAMAESGAPFGTWSTQGHHQMWIHLETDQSALPAATELALLTASEVVMSREQDEWNNLQLRLQPSSDHAVRVPGIWNKARSETNPKRGFEMAGLQGSTADGTLVELEAIRQTDPNEEGQFVSMLKLPADGMVIAGRFRKSSRFAAAASRISLKVLTDAGVETVLLSDSFNDADVAPATPFGPVTAGVKLRIRPAKQSFHEGEPMKFHYQARNVSGNPVCWWKPVDNIGQNIIIEIDGKRIEIPYEKAEYIGGWAATWTCQTPEERTFTLPAGLKLKGGKHALLYGISSKGGTYTNSENSPIPLLSGELRSNETEFSVE